MACLTRMIVYSYLEEGIYVQIADLHKFIVKAVAEIKPYFTCRSCSYAKNRSPRRLLVLRLPTADR